MSLAQRLFASERQKKQWSNIVVLTMAILSVFALGGCQIQMSGAVGAKAFYPDAVGTAKIGDPREGEYAPGHAETNSAGQFDGGFLLSKAPPAGDDPKGGE